MANPTLHWRMLTPRTVSSGSAATFLDALYLMGTDTTYADGTARVPGVFTTPGTASLPASRGTNQAWTWNYDTATLPDGKGSKTAIYGYPPGAASALNQAIVIAGTSNVGGANWKQLSGDTRTANYMVAGIAKNSGLYTSWNNNITPFSVGDFTGFGHAAGPAGAYSIVYMWESEEAVIVLFAAPASNGISGFIAGAVVDPLTANTSAAEADGRLYGITNTGAIYMSGTWLSVITPGSGQFFYNSNTAGDQHSVTFTPGAGTLTVTNRFGGFTPSVAFASRNGDLPEIPMQLTNGTQFLGQLRQIFITRDSVTGVAWQVGATTKGYLLGASVTSAGDACLLAY